MSKMILKTHGRGSIQAWPYETGDSEAMPIAHDLDERGELRLWRKRNLWEVKTADGRVLLVPAQLAIVVWDVDAAVPRYMPLPPRSDVPRWSSDVPAAPVPPVSPVPSIGAIWISAFLGITKEEALAQMTRLAGSRREGSYTCPHCLTPYGRQLESYICYRRCMSEVVPGAPRGGFKGGSCSRCGFPAELHPRGPNPEVEDAAELERNRSGRCILFDGTQLCVVKHLNPTGDGT